MLAIVGKLTQTRVEHVEAALPVSIKVPSKRETIEALNMFQKVDLPKGYADALDVIHRFVNTR